ncbi:MAG: hypothetical protein HC876_06265 [Chloroflexaceae bacterium]|nr:hypothetical protein [Chloroflexaceae bacterium]NJO05147.1 hypothetical protein [Chloroflexaceae bacterium]
MQVETRKPTFRQRVERLLPQRARPRIEDRVAQQGHQLVNQVAHTAHHAINTTQGQVNGQIAATHQQVKQTRHQVERTTSQVRNQADAALTNVGNTLQTAATAVRASTPDVSPLTSGIAGRLQRSAEYFRNAGPEDISADLDRTIRRNPYPLLFIGIGIGLLIGWLLWGMQRKVQEQKHAAHTTDPNQPDSGKHNTTSKIGNYNTTI